MISFVVPGKPRVQQRARVLRNGWAFDPSKADKKVIAEYALAAKRSAMVAILQGDVILKVDCYGMRSNSDLDNAVKLVQDACNDVLYLDDRQIVMIIARKIKDELNPRTVISVEQAPEDLDQQTL